MSDQFTINIDGDPVVVQIGEGTAEAIRQAQLAEQYATLAVQASNATIYQSWAALSGVTGSPGDSAIVFEDEGTHSDPVTSSTVANAGIYLWSASPAGWERIADTEAARADAFAAEAEGFAVDAGTAKTGAEDARDDALAAVSDAQAAAAEAAQAVTDAGDVVQAVSDALAVGTVSDLVGTRIYASRSALEADLVPADNEYALVVGDATAANNDIYQKNGATTAGSWDGPLGIFAAASAAAQAAAEVALESSSATRPSLFDPARNIFNPLAITVGAGIEVSGLLTSLSSAYALTDWMPVRPGGKIRVSRTINYGGPNYGMVFFNSGKEVVGYDEGNIPAGTVFNVPDDAVWARFTITAAVAANLIVTDFDTTTTPPPADVAYARAGETARMVKGGIERYGESIYSTVGMTVGALNANTGAIDAFANFRVTDYLPFPAGTPLRFNAQTSVGAAYGPTFYNDANQRVWADPTPTTAGQIITPPPGATKMRVTVHQDQLANFDVRLWGLEAPWAGATPWTGLQAAVLGDSITAAAQDWMGQVCSLMGMTLKTKAARNGRRMVDALLAADGVTPLTSADFDDVALTVLFLGTNNAGDATTIGTIADSTATATFFGQAKKAVEQVLTWNPEQRFVICSLLYRATVGVDIEPYNDALREVAAYYALPLCDLRTMSGFSPFNASWSIPDNLHPSTDGYDRLLIPAVRGFLQALAPVA